VKKTPDFYFTIFSAQTRNYLQKIGQKKAKKKNREIKYQRNNIKKANKNK